MDCIKNLPAMVLILAACFANAAEKNYEPRVGQDGKDVIWVPNPDVMVSKMLDMARITGEDFVIDLGSGDGRNVIGAALRGARGRGVEFNPDLVAYARQRAAAAGVADRAQFVEGDMFAVDVSQASVLALFLLPDNLRKLTPKFVDMKPGSRIVSNTYEIPGWPADTSETVREGCAAFCIVFLYVVPAKVAGTWRTPDGELNFEQDYQRLSGSYVYSGITLPLENARMHGAEIRFTANGVEYSGRVEGDVMQGRAKGRQETEWRAMRVP